MEKHLASAGIWNTFRSRTNFCPLDLSNMCFKDRNLSRYCFDYCDLSHADLRGINLTRASFTLASLRCAKLNGACLDNTSLYEANLLHADFSDATGLLSAAEWVKENLEATKEGYIAYKLIGHMHPHPIKWELEKGAVWHETVNPLRTDDCACGINLGTRNWVATRHIRQQIWKLLIRWEWLPDVVVPYSTCGKFRCGTCEAVQPVRI